MSRPSMGLGRKLDLSDPDVLELKGFSCQGLIDQLSSEYGDKFTVEQARYGATQAGLC